MIRIWGLEYYKLRRKKIGLMLLSFLSVEMLWAFLSISRSIAKNPDHAVWEALIFNISSMNGLFLPILSAIIVSRICDMEHKGATWKMLAATNVSRNRLYAAKYVCAVSLLLLGLLAQMVLMAGFGILKNFPEPLPAGLLIRFLGGAMLPVLVVTALQQWLSLAVKNQAFALCLGMLGGLAGMTAGLFPAAVRHALIWSYFLDLSPVLYQFGASSGAYSIQTQNAGLTAAALVMTILFYIAGSIHASRQEI